MQHKILKLKNGLEVIFVDSKESQTASVHIWFKAGSALENGPDHGIAHFLEHMFFKGTSKRPEGKITYDVETFGGEINAFTSFDYTCYYINTPADNLLESVDILLDMVSAPLFKQEELIPEREVVFEEYRRSIDNPRQFGFMKTQESSFTGGYQHPIIGNEGTIKSFNLDQLKNFRSKYYNNQNAFFLVAGNLEPIEKDLSNLIERYSLPNGQTADFEKFELKNKDTVSFHHKEVRMCNLTWSIPAFGYQEAGSEHEDMALSILGHGDSSRLYTKLVADTGYANNCSTSTMFFKKGGVHIVSINFPTQNAAKVLNALYEELEKILNEGTTDHEILKIKNQYLASKIYDLESIENYAFSLGHSYAITGDITGEEKYLSRIKSSHKHQIEKALGEIISKNWHFSIQLPKENSETDVKKHLNAFLKKKGNLKKIGLKPAPYIIKTSKVDPLAKTLEIKPGIRFFYRSNKTSPTFVLHAYLKGGLTEETHRTNGLYNLLSSQLTNGHKHMSYEELRNYFDDRASSLNAFSGKNAYGITMHGQSEHFYGLAENFFHSMLIPEFPKKYFSLERNLQLRGIDNQKEDPVRQCFNIISNIMFPGHPYSLNSLGTKESVKKLNHTLLKKIHYANLTKKEILITYCGDKDLEEVLLLVKNFTDKLQPRKSGKPKIKKYKYVAMEKTLNFPREQAQVFIGLPIGNFAHKDQIYIKMFTSFLSGQSSELFVDVRDKKGLCYSVSPINFNALEGGYFGIFMGSGKDKVEEAFKAILDLFEKYKKSPMSSKEFDRIKSMIKGQNILNLQTNDDFASTYSVPLLHAKDIDFVHEIQQKIDSLSYQDFCRGISEILSRPISTVLVGPLLIQSKNKNKK